MARALLGHLVSLAYWMVSLLTTLVSFPKVMLRKQAERARWTSPDRGIKSPDAS